MRRRIVVSLLPFLVVGCGSTNRHIPEANSDPQTMNQKSQFTVQDVFYIAPPVDSVIATGVVAAGTFRVGDAIIVADSIASEIGKIEAYQQGEVQEATVGANVGFHLTGVNRNQVKSGDKIVGRD